MPAGLQIFDSLGNLVADHTTQFGRYTGIIWTGSHLANSFYDASLLSGQSWYLRVAPPGSPYGPLYNPVHINISGGTISWSWPGGQRHVWIIYGVF